MAVKASNGITITDVTDACSVTLSSEAVAVPGNLNGNAVAGSVTTNVYAFCGSTQCTCAMGTVTRPTGISSVTAKPDTNNTQTLVITVTYTTELTAAEPTEITIPINVTGVNGEVLSFTKKFSLTVAKTGATGAPGDNPYTLVLTGNTVIKNNSGSTFISAHVYQAGAELTKVPSGCKLCWYVGGSTTAATSVAAGGTLPATYEVKAGVVTNSLLVTAQLETA
jgi:hypothetical protein